jgi:predicted GIY-YIG superfamily endonuclease
MPHLVGQIRGIVMAGKTPVAPVHTVYLLRCADGSFYTGMTSDLRLRLDEHNLGVDTKAYTYPRRPVTFAWSHDFPTHDAAFVCERRLKGWSRAKKEALIAGGLEAVHWIVRKEWEEEHT